MLIKSSKLNFKHTEIIIIIHFIFIIMILLFDILEEKKLIQWAKGAKISPHNSIYHEF